MGPVLPSLYKYYRQLEQANSITKDLTKKELVYFRAARRSARRRGIRFALTEQELAVLIARAKGRCEMTRIVFSDKKFDDQRFRPFRMSLDRIRNDGDYEIDNCHLVIAAYNFAKGTMSIEGSHLIMLEYARHLGAEIPDYLVEYKGDDMWEY